jgi:P-type Ca2+ transporter type 2C
MRTLAEIKAHVPVSLQQGLTPEGVTQSRAAFGANRLTALPRPPIWKKFIEKFDEPIIKILLAAALLSMVVDLFKANPIVGAISLVIFAGLVTALFVFKQGEWLPSLLFGSALLMFFAGLASGHVLVEGLAVMIAVILATGVAFASEYKSDREFEVLNARKDTIQAKVMREGSIHALNMEDVVAGDVVLLEMGDEVPADGRLFKATELLLDQSLMTGESEPVRKRAHPVDDKTDGTDQPGCLYRGTQVVDGVGEMLVTEVGDDTSLGQIARRLSTDGDLELDQGGPAQDDPEKRARRKLTISKEMTPLQEKLSSLADTISKVGYVAAVLIFLAQLVRGIGVGEVFLPGTKSDFGSDLLQVFGELINYVVTMVIIIVVAVPEGLPMSVTVSLALAMRKMTRANSLVRQLAACETIGSATVICTDKTGTLTRNQMQVARVCWEDRVMDRSGNGFVIPQATRGQQPLDWLALNAALNSTANLEKKEGKTVTIGNSTEGALLQWLLEGKLEYAQIRLQTPALYQIHFSSERKRMTTVVRHNNALVALVKGAPEWVLGQCNQYLSADGKAQPLTPDMRVRVLAKLRESSGLAMRTLGFAYGMLPPQTPQHQDGLHAVRDSLETGLTYVGFVGIRDPLRDDVHDALVECRRAGIAVKMVTGDTAETARAIGYEVGLVESREQPIDEPGSAILTSRRFNQLSDDDLKNQLPSLRILARAKPLDKYRLVKALQELGEVVAVTGDGTNDAPALKKADVGLAMGIAGTEVAKEASKIVLLDDSFATIVKAVQWGRALYENIQRFLQFQLTINISALTITFLGILFFNVKAPFTVLQLLWINVIMDTFASIALCSEPPRPEVMKLPPKRRDEDILTPAMFRTMLTTAGFFVVVMLGLLLLMKGSPGSPGWFGGDGAVVVDNHFTIFQVSLFFSIYVFFQVWNQINCRSLNPETSGFYRLGANPTFLAIAGVVALGQIIIVTFGGKVFNVEPLGILPWVAVMAFTATVLIFAEASRRIRLLRSTAHQ